MPGVTIRETSGIEVKHEFQANPGRVDSKAALEGVAPTPPAPSLVITSPLAGTRLYPGVLQTITYASSDVTSVEFFWEGVSIGTSTPDGGGEGSFDWTPTTGQVALSGDLTATGTGPAGAALAGPVILDVWAPDLIADDVLLFEAELSTSTAASVTDPSDLSTGAWTRVGLVEPPTANFGGSGLTRIVANATTAYAQQVPANFSTSGLNFPVSVVLQANTGSGWAYVELFNLATGRIWINLATGTIGTVGGLLVDATVSNLGGGKYRLTFRTTPGANYVRIAMASADNTLTCAASDAILVGEVTVTQVLFNQFTNPSTGVVWSQATLLSKPQVETRNGRVWLQAGGQSEIISSDAAVVAAIQNQQPYTLMMVVEVSAKSGQAFFGAGNSATATNRTKYWGASATGANAGKWLYSVINSAGSSTTIESNDDLVGTGTLPTGTHIVTFRSDGTNLEMRVDREPTILSATAEQSGTIDPNRVAFFSRPDSSPDNRGNGRLGAVFMWSRRLSDAEVVQPEDYLRAKYDTSWRRPYYPINPARITVGLWVGSDIRQDLASWPARVGANALTNTNGTLGLYTRPDGTTTRCITLNGTTAFLRNDAIASALSALEDPEVTVVLGIKPSSSATTQTIIGWASSTTANLKWALHHNGAAAYTLTKNTTSVNFQYAKTANGNTTSKLLVIQDKGTTVDLYFNTVRDQSGPLACNVAAQTLSTFVLGGRTNGSATVIDHFAGDIYFILITKVAGGLTQAEIDEIRAWCEGDFDVKPVYTSPTTFATIGHWWQSNAVGRDTGTPQATTVNASVRMSEESDRRTQIALANVTSHPDDSSGPWLRMAYELYQADVKAHFALSGLGDTGISAWLQQNDPAQGRFRELKSVANRVRYRVGGPVQGYSGLGASRSIGHTHKYVLCGTGGETDGQGSGTATILASQLALFKADARDSFGEPDMKMFFLTLNPNFTLVPELATINAQFASSDATDGNMHLVNPNRNVNLTLGDGYLLNESGTIHYSNTGQLEVGRAYAEEYLAYAT